MTRDLVLFLTLAGLAVAAVLMGLVLADDGLVACQTLHSFDVCHAALY